MRIIASTRALLFRQRRLSFLQQFPEITLGKCENLELLNLPGGRRAGGGWWRQEEGTPACWLPFILATGPGGVQGGRLTDPQPYGGAGSALPLINGLSLVGRGGEEARGSFLLLADAGEQRGGARAGWRGQGVTRGVMDGTWLFGQALGVGSSCH